MNNYIRILIIVAVICLVSVSSVFIIKCHKSKPVEPPKVTEVAVKQPTPIVKTNTVGDGRCNDYKPDIRKYALQYIGLDYPYWYNVGCAMAESSCRGNITSFDGGIGLFQLTPSTGITSEISKYIPVNPHNVESNIRAQAYYVHLILSKHFKSGEMTFKSKYKINPSKHVENCGLNLADVYRFYNSGYWFFHEANINSLSCSNNDMSKKCVRGGTCAGKQYLSFCQISYSYPIKIYKYSEQYKVGSDGTWKFWYTASDTTLKTQFPLKTCN